MQKNLSKYTGNIVYVLLLNLVVLVIWRAGMYWFEFQDPKFFWLLLLIPALSLWYILKSTDIHPEIRISTVGYFRNIRSHWKIYLKSSWFFFRMLALALLILGIARPQSRSSWQDVNAEGIDIVISFDISGSMLAKDFHPNRLESAKDVAMDFIDKRRDDRIGLVVFGGDAFTQCPLTTDHRVLKELFGEVSTTWTDGSTALGMGLATAVNRLRESQSKSKVVILLTDGVNTSGNISPVTAAEIAREYGITIYSIGIGSHGKALSPVAISNGQYIYDYVEVEIDEATMRQISRLTGGRYFRATNKQALIDIYNEIDKMEKTRLKVTEFSRKKEEFLWFAAGAAILLLIEFVTRNTIFKSIP